MPGARLFPPSWGTASARTSSAWAEEAKLRIRMELGGRAWRGYFPVGAEFTSARTDVKEELHFGRELDASDPHILGKVSKVLPELRKTAF